MRRSTLILFLLVTLYSYAQELTINESGKKLKKFYLGLDVEHLWLAGGHVNCQTGLPDAPSTTEIEKSHSPVFVAELCHRQGLYILRPPQHPQDMLANDQCDWLTTAEAKIQGWNLIAGDDIYKQAQDYANKGHVVVAIYKNAAPNATGHVAAVMPALISSKELSEEGPKIIMAGTHNFNNISLKAGFKHHVTTWPASGILFYYNVKETK